MTPVESTAPIGADRLIKLPELLVKTAMSRAEIYRRIKNDATFPKPISMGMRSIAFSEAEVASWIRGRIALRDAQRGVAA